MVARIFIGFIIKWCLTILTAKSERKFIGTWSHDMSYRFNYIFLTFDNLMTLSTYDNDCNTFNNTSIFFFILPTKYKSFNHSWYHKKGFVIRESKVEFLGILNPIILKKDKKINEVKKIFLWIVKLFFVLARR